MGLKERVKYLLSKMGTNAKRVEEELGLANGYISKLDKFVPSSSKLRTLADYFGVSVDFLLTGEENPEPERKPQGIPVLGLVRAGIPLEEQENIMDYIPATMKHPEEYFALVVKGDSMQPRLFEGDIVIVHSQPDAENGELVVAKVNGDEACVKRLLKYSHSIALQSLNPAYPLMTFSEEQITSMPVTILGKVVKMEARF